MNILSIKNLNYTTPLFSKNLNNNSNDKNIWGLKLEKPLEQDTICFKAKIGELYASTVEKKAKELRLEAKSNVFRDVAAGVANELKHLGVDFDIKYNEQHPIKDSTTFVDKIIRASEVRDWLRGTMYIENPYDLSILRDGIIPAFRKRNFRIASIPIKTSEAIKRGFTPTAAEIKEGKMEIPDISIRLKNAEKHVERTAPDYIKYAEGPAKSGYEDIQLRFENPDDKTNPAIYYELILFFGKNYAEAKGIESEKVYKHLRKFSNLSIRKDDKLDIKTETLLNEYIDTIRDKFRIEISEKLFTNAKNKDFLKSNEEKKIAISLEDEVEITEAFINLENLVERFYKTRFYGAKSDKVLKSKIRKNWNDDKKILESIRTNLSETISYFNNEYYKPKKVKNAKNK